MKQIVRNIEKNKLLISESVDEAGVYNKTGFREKMLVNNRIDGILELSVYVTDNRKTYEYDTTGLNTLESFCIQKKTETPILREILKGICRTVINGENFMLEDNDFVLNPEYIFLDKDSHPYVAYSPGYDKPLSEQIGHLAEYLMNRIDYRDKDTVLLTYTIYMKCREESFYIGDLLEFLEKENDTSEVNCGENRPIEQMIVDRQPDLHSQTPIFEENEYSVRDTFESVTKRTINKESQRAVFKLIYLLPVVLPALLVAAGYKLGLVTLKNGRIDLAKAGAIIVLGCGIAVYILKKLNLTAKPQSNVDADEPTELLYGKTEIDDEATELLFDRSSGDRKEETYMLESDRYPLIRMDYFPFSIGKDKEHMDYCLDYSGVSRRHAKIDKTSSGIYISDTGSKNGIFVNGKRISPGIPCPIEPGDTIEMGVCTYTLRKNISG